jgi:uncharacterized protein YycO
MIQLRFIEGTGPISRAIEFWTWSSWSHVDVMTPDGWLGARFVGGVQVRPWDYVTTYGKSEIRGISLDPDVEARIMSYLYDQVGKPYDFGAIAGMMVRRDWKNESKWFCSELVIASFAVNGVDLLNTSTMNRISPRDLYMTPLLTLQPAVNLSSLPRCI